MSLASQTLDSGALDEVVITTVWKSHNTQNRDLCENFSCAKVAMIAARRTGVCDKNQKLREA